MGEKNLWSKLALIIILVGMCLWQCYPIDKRLRPGIDLGGGHSLLFEIDDTGIESSDLAQRVMTVLKNRVDPQGNRNLVWRPIGRNRLEIQMPRRQQTGREDYEKAREALASTNITETQIRSALQLEPAARDEAFKKMVGPYTSRETLFQTLAQADEDFKRLSAEFAQMQAAHAATQPADTQSAGTQPTTAAASQPTTQAVSELAAKVDEAFLAQQEAIQKLINTNLDTRMLEDILELGKKNEVRASKLEEITLQHSDLADLINDMTSKYDVYAETKGVLDDPSDLMRLLRGAGVLEFRILATPDPENLERLKSTNAEYNEPVSKYTEQLAKYGPRKQAGDNYAWFRISSKEEDSFTNPRLGFVTAEYAGAKYVLALDTPDMGLLQSHDNWSLRSARAGRDSMGRLAIDFQLAGTGPGLFGDLTSRNIDRPLCIFLDGEAISAANIKSAIYDSGQITGRFTPEYVDYVVRTLEAGTLPARLKETPLQQKSVGPSLGATNQKRGQEAVVIAMIVTVLFMIIYYGYNGFIADIALLMNLVITLGVMSFLQATFTLPGIAGLVLTLGMAVDANVLIYERIREELQRGISVRMAVKLGYEKAFSAILDSNVTTIITAVILGSLGSEEIKGFGLTLGIGLCTSMFTALFVTRRFFDVMTPTSLNPEESRRTWLMVGLLIAAAAIFMGAGYVFASQESLDESTLFGLGTFLAWLAGTAVALVLALWIFRVIYSGLGHQKANRLPMMRLFSAPNINWMQKYRVFWTFSGAVIVLGLILESRVNPDDYLDIEFIGGTNVQIQLKSNETQVTSDEQVLALVTNGQDEDTSTSVGWLRHAASTLKTLKITSAAEGRFEIEMPEEFTAAQMEALLMPVLSEELVRGGVTPSETGVVVRVKANQQGKAVLDESGMKEKLLAAAEYAGQAADRLRNARIQEVSEDTSTEETGKSFEIITTEKGQRLVAQALLASMHDLLEVTQAVEARLVTDPDSAPEGIHPLRQTDANLATVLGDYASGDISDFKTGVVMEFADLNPALSQAEVKDRLTKLRLQSDFEDISWRKFEVFGIEAAESGQMIDDNTPCTRVAIAVVDPNIPYVEGEEEKIKAWREQVADKELALAKAAFARTQSLERVTSFDAQVAGEAVTKAIIAIILSMLAIAAYLWVRFGSVQFGLAGIIALFHDVAITLSAVMACHHLYNTGFGRMLGLEDFRIDLAMIAAFLTIVGYSINDTIVIFDRIRENRGRLATINANLINQSINQTLSRTLITSLTTLMAVVVMYVVGGSGIHGFAFAMIVGSISGTYSTIAIATPMLNHPRIMWSVAIGIGALIAIGLSLTISFVAIKYALIIIVLILAVLGIAKQVVGTGNGKGRQAFPV